jgi:hypothetical protein
MAVGDFGRYAGDRRMPTISTPSVLTKGQESLGAPRGAGPHQQGLGIDLRQRAEAGRASAGVRCRSAPLNGQGAMLGRSLAQPAGRHKPSTSHCRVDRLPRSAGNGGGEATCWLLPTNRREIMLRWCLPAPSARSELVHREGPTVQIRFPPPPSVGDDLGGGSNDPLGERGVHCVGCRLGRERRVGSQRHRHRACFPR